MFMGGDATIDVSSAAHPPLGMKGVCCLSKFYLGPPPSPPVLPILPLCQQAAAGSSYGETTARVNALSLSLAPSCDLLLLLKFPLVFGSQQFLVAYSTQHLWQKMMCVKPKSSTKLSCLGQDLRLLRTCYCSQPYLKCSGTLRLIAAWVQLLQETAGLQSLHSSASAVTCGVMQAATLARPLVSHCPVMVACVA